MTIQTNNSSANIAACVDSAVDELGTPTITGTDVVKTVEGSVDGIQTAGMSNMAAIVSHAIAAAIPDEASANEVYSQDIRDAAAIGGAIGTNASAVFGAKLAGWDGSDRSEAEMLAPIGTAFNPEAGGAYALPQTTIENYEDSALQPTVSAAISYNLNAALQNQFSAGFFRAKSISPGSVGIVIAAEEIVIINEFNHGPNGDPIKQKGTSIIRAMSNPSLLNIDHTKIFPALLPDREKYFVDAAIVAPTTIRPLGEDIETAPLATGIDINLLSLSQSAGDMAIETLNRTDTIDPAVSMEAIYVKVGDDVLKFRCSNLPGIIFNYDGKSSSRRMNLGISIDSLVVTKDTLDNSLAALVTLAAIASEPLKVRLSTYLSGYIDLDSGRVHLNKSTVSVYSVTDEDDVPIAPSDARYSDLVALVEGSIVEGFDVNANKTNANRRERGILFDTRVHMQPYNVPYGPPMSILRAPGATSASTDQKLIGNLTDISRTASNLRAPEAILAFANDMVEFANVVDDELNPPDSLGPARFLMTPYATVGEIDLEDLVASLSTHEVGDDIAMAMINFVNSHVDELLTRTHIVDAYEKRFGAGARPTVVIGSSHKVIQALEHPGNSERLCPGFKVKKFATNHASWRNKADKIDKLFISFDNPGSPGDDPFSFGFFAWAPVTPLTLNNTQRGNTTSRELTVVPRNEFYVNAVACSLIDVVGLTEMSREPVIARVKAVT